MGGYADNNSNTENGGREYNDEFPFHCWPPFLAFSASLFS
jgi:hypothetical protein